MREAQRLFIALPVTDGIRAAATRLQDRLRRTDADVSYPQPDLLHFTLVFLGDALPAAIPGLSAGLDRAASGFPALALQVAGLGFFGPPRHPRVVWAGVADPPSALFDLHKSMLAIVSELGFSIERIAWQPHLTLGRIRSARGLDGLTVMINSLKEEALGGCLVERVELMCSHPGQPRPCYTILHSAKLKGT